MNATEREVIGPQEGPQTVLLEHRDVFEIFMGGSRWGGKTFGVLLDWCIHQDEYGAKASGLMVRRTFKELEDTIKVAHTVFPKLGAKWSNSTDKHATYVFPNDAELRFRHLDNDADTVHFLGHKYSRLYVEEAGAWPSPDAILKLMATLQVPGVKCGIRVTSNPGGQGTAWLCQRYINPAPKGYTLLPTEYEIPDPVTGKVTKVVKHRLFIPTYTKDNKYSYTPDNVANLYEATSTNPMLKRAWVDGDFTVQLGQFFPEFSIHRHVVTPFEPPHDWLRFFVIDWGSSEPCGLTWWTVVGDGYTLKDGTFLPRGALVCYREHYLCRRDPLGNGSNVGLGKTSEDVATIIFDAENNEPKDADGRPRIAYRVSDTKLFQVDAGPCIAERMLRSHGLSFRSANTKRTTRTGVPAGWDYLRSRLIGVDGRPMIYWFATAIDSIRVIPLMQHDPNKPGDLISEGVEDHAVDCARYATMSRPWVASGGTSSVIPIGSPEQFDTKAVTSTRILALPPPGGWFA